MNILVTGGAGFIGSHTIGKLLTLGHKVICLDNLNNYYDLKIKHQNITGFSHNFLFRLYQLDICDKDSVEKVFKKENIDKIIHLAAQVGVRNSFKKPLTYARVNILGTINLLKLAQKYKISSFIFGSSSSVYGNNKPPFMEEDITDSPISPYGASKKTAELLCFTYHKNFALPVTILRFFTVYGPRGRPDMAPYLFTEAVFKGKPINQFGDGLSKRDYTYIEDIVSGIVKATEKSFPFEIINLGRGETIFLIDFIKVIEEFLGKKAKINIWSFQKGDVKETWANIKKAKRLLDYKPKWDIKSGMKEFINWYISKNN